jgi:hypothetical protein
VVSGNGGSCSGSTCSEQVRNVTVKTANHVENVCRKVDMLLLACWEVNLILWMRKIIIADKSFCSRMWLLPKHVVKV